ncbi:hypothetical protein FRC15_009541 [Serendipita sp. 397]|nr:hypothetical protein FRC15_009541 [Serendipita sp. 397]
MAHEELIAVFEYLIGTLKYTASPSYLLEDVFSVLETRPEIIDDPKVAPYLPKLISLQPSLSISSSLYRVLREQVNASLPSGLKPINLHGNASEFMQKIEMKWRRHARKPSVEVLRVIMPLLELDDSEILDLASQAMFQSSAVRDMVAHWLIAQTNLNHSTHFALEVLMETSSENTLYMREIGQRLGPPCTTLAMSTSTSNPQRESYQSTLFKLLPLVEEGHILVKRVVGLFSKRPTANVIPFLARLAQTGRVTQNDVEKILLLSIKELVSLLNEPLKSKEVIQAIPHLATFGNVSAESLDALFNISIRNHLTDSSVMTALSLLFHKISLKPAGCNRLIQAILHHSQFSTAASPNSTSREPLVDILYCLFKMHPQNTCQPSHITPLIRVYRGSLSVPDLSLLEIFRLFEQQRKYSVASLMASWGPDPGVVSTDILNAIIGLNSNLLFATCVEFPQWRTTQKSCTAEAHRSKSSLYDPFFILLLLHSYLSTQGGGRTLTPLDWVGFFRTNIASLVISSLSARHGDIRGLGWTAFGGLCNAVAQAEFYEKAQTFYIFKMLSRLHKATPANESPTENPRLSTYATLFFAHAIRAVYTPASSLYPLVSRFLLQRPEFDLNDPPMLYSMLYSSLSSDFGKRGGNWKRERVWMLRFLADGMVSSQDWKVLQRRHTWDLLATTYHTHSNDGAIKQGVLKVLLRMTQNQRVVTSLVCHSHLLSWASFTISGMSRIEDENTVMSWCQALENIVVFVDHERVTKRMGILWRDQLLLCVNKLLNYITGNATTYSMDQSLEGLCTLTRIIQRFSSLPDTPVERETLFKALGALKSVETGLDISLGEARQWSPPVSKWGEIQERLWLTMMSMDKEQKYDLWGILTARMVGLGSVKPPVLSEGTSAWVRIEVLHLLSQSDS